MAGLPGQLVRQLVVVELSSGIGIVQAHKLCMVVRIALTSGHPRRVLVVRIWTVQVRILVLQDQPFSI